MEAIPFTIVAWSPITVLRPVLTHSHDVSPTAKRLLSVLAKVGVVALIVSVTALILRNA